MGRSKAEMRGLISASKKRRGSMKDFCQDHNLNLATFYYWKKKLETTNGTDGFVSLEVGKKNQSSEKGEEENLIVLVFRGLPDPEYVKALIE